MCVVLVTFSFTSDICFFFLKFYIYAVIVLFAFSLGTITHVIICLLYREFTVELNIVGTWFLETSHVLEFHLIGRV